MIYYGKSDIGMVRDNNEDCFGIYPIGDAVLLVVCDGMGGENCGEVASALALEAFSSTVITMCTPKLISNHLLLSDLDAYVVLSNAASRANSAVLAHQNEHEECTGMGTTLVAALVTAGARTVSWINVGDSRLYTVDEKDILQVSKDHSYIQYLVDTGEITSEEAKTSKERNLITRAIGMRADVEPDIDTFPLSEQEAADTYILLCSDGLSGLVGEEECYAIVRDPALSTEEKVDKLIEAAKEAGGADNITVVLATNGKDV